MAYTTIPQPTTDLRRWAAQVAAYLGQLEIKLETPGPKIIQLEHQRDSNPKPVSATQDGILMWRSASQTVVVTRDNGWHSILDLDTADDRYVNVTGDTMSGQLVIRDGSTPLVVDSVDGGAVGIAGQRAGTVAWGFGMHNNGMIAIGNGAISTQANHLFRVDEANLLTTVFPNTPGGRFAVPIAGTPELPKIELGPGSGTGIYTNSTGSNIIFSALGVRSARITENAIDTYTSASGAVTIRDATSGLTLGAMAVDTGRTYTRLAKYDNAGNQLAYMQVTADDGNTGSWTSTAPNGSSLINRTRGDARYAPISSQRFKDDVLDHPEDTLAYAFDQLQVKSWIWGGELPEMDERYGHVGIGFIAEEVTQVLPAAGLYRWVDQEGEDKQLHGLDPMAMMAVLVAKIRGLEQRITELQNEMDATRDAH